MKRVITLPDPTPKSVVLWLSQLDRDTLHTEGWQQVNQRFHSIARSVRPFILEHYPETADQEAAFDGLTLALLTMAHFTDVQQLSEDLGSLTSTGTTQGHSSDKKDSPQLDRQ
jgi:hypothetical protein